MKGAVTGKVRDTLEKWRKTFRHKLIVQRFRTKVRRTHK